MASFTPPANATENPPILPESRGPAAALFRHYRGRPVGRNVFIYSDSTVSEVDPDGVSTFWQEVEGTPFITGHSAVSGVFYGGHDNQYVTAAQATLLTNAGYTVT